METNYFDCNMRIRSYRDDPIRSVDLRGSQPFRHPIASKTDVFLQRTDRSDLVYVGFLWIGFWTVLCQKRLRLDFSGTGTRITLCLLITVSEKDG
jgi:hypothetical protein